MRLHCSIVAASLCAMFIALEAFGAHIQLLSEAMQKSLSVICETEKASAGGLQKFVYVNPDGLAGEAGVNDGDEIVSVNLVLDSLKLSLKRNGLPLQLSVKLSKEAGKIFEKQEFSLQLSQIATLGSVSANSPTRLSRQSPKLSAPVPVLDVQQRDDKLPVLDVTDSARTLSKFQMELIVDQSMSMARNDDCPGSLTRWNWCGMQATELARAMAPFAQSGITITTFNSGYQIRRHAAAQDLVQLFAYPNFHFGTRLAEPLADRLSEYFAHRQPQSKPRLVAVITDGIPVPKQIEPAMVVRTLVDASNRMRNPSEVTIVFFQIGSRARFGQDFLQYLDQNLSREGARNHLVHTIPFDVLVKDGLAKCLAQSVQTYGYRK